MYLLLIANQQMRSRFILMDCMVLNFLVEDYSVIALSSTGIGVTPAISIVQDIVQRRSNGIGTVASSSVNLYWSIRCISKVHNSKQVFKKSYRLPCFLIDEINPFMTTFSRWNQQIWNALLPAKLNVKIYVTRSMQQDHAVQRFPDLNLHFNGRPEIETEMKIIKIASTWCQKTWVHVCDSTSFAWAIINEALKVDFEIFEF